MDKREALEICRDLWDDLARTGSDDKGSWPGWEKHGLLYFACPCCHYVMNKHDGRLLCEDCPLLTHWGGTYLVAPCCDKVSPFDKWARAKTPKNRKKYAKIIADFARTELEKM